MSLELKGIEIENCHEHGLKLLRFQRDGLEKCPTWESTLTLT